MSARTVLPRAQYGKTGKLTEQEIKRVALQSLILLAAAHMVLALHMLAGRPWDTTLGKAVLLLGAVTLLAYWLSRRSVILGSSVLVSGIISGIAMLARAGAPTVIWAFLPLPVVLSGALFEPAAAFAVGALAAAVAYVGGPWEQSHLAYSVSPLLTGLCVWAAYRPEHSSLHTFLRRSLEATSLAEQLRDERGKLNRTIKALDDSYQLLEKTNRELVLARQEADQLRDLRSRFATNLSHELRTPLNIILGFSQIVCLKPQMYGYSKWSDSLLRDLAEIRRNAGYLAQLVDDIVDLARVDALAMPVQREPTDLGGLVQEAVAAVRSPAADRNVVVTAQCPSDIPLVSIDPLRIRQVLYNLLTNAIRHTSDGEVRVDVRVVGDEVITSVTDTGCGIPSEELTAIFNEFYQVGRPKQSADAGKGLGLAIAKRFVQLHGGRIWAESEVGKGSVFSFALPLHAKSVGLARQAGATPMPPQRELPLVLVVNDDGMAAPYLRRRLQGYEFAPVHDPSEVTEAVAGRRLMAVIVNGKPGNGNAETWDGVLHALPEDVPVIQCALPSNEWVFGEGQFAAVLTKPVTPEDVLGTVARLVNGNEAARVLLVDDDRGFVQLLARILESDQARRYEIAKAYSGQEALQKVRHFRPQLMLLDLRLPDLTGFSVLDQLREDGEYGNLPVVAVTAATPGEDQLAAEGAYFMCAKRGMFRPGELVRLIAAAVAPTQVCDEVTESAPALQAALPVSPAS